MPFALEDHSQLIVFGAFGGDFFQMRCVSVESYALTWLHKDGLLAEVRKRASILRNARTRFGIQIDLLQLVLCRILQCLRRDYKHKTHLD